MQRLSAALAEGDRGILVRAIQTTPGQNGCVTSTRMDSGDSVSDYWNSWLLCRVTVVRDTECTGNLTGMGIQSDGHPTVCLAELNELYSVRSTALLQRADAQ